MLSICLYLLLMPYKNTVFFVLEIMLSLAKHLGKLFKLFYLTYAYNVGICIGYFGGLDLKETVHLPNV